MSDKTIYTCDHCNKEVDSYWPSGGEDLICKTCFDHYVREQEENEDWEDYASRHPYFGTLDDGTIEYDPLRMTLIFLRSIQKQYPELKDLCLANVKYLQEEEKRKNERMESYIKQLQQLQSFFHDDEEETPDEYFDRKYPNASCHRCETPLNSKTVVFCGGGGGACETWYCQDCHEEGTEDCKVCCVE